MRKVVNISIVSVLVLFACACRRTVHSTADYVACLDDANGRNWIKQKIGPIEYTIQMVTPLYFVCKELSRSAPNQAEFKSRLKELDGHLYFILRINDTRNEIGTALATKSQSTAEREVTYYEGEARNSIHLRSGSKDLTPLAYTYENNYGLAPYNSIVLCFKMPQESAPIRLVFDDLVHANRNISVEFDRSVLSQFPVLSN